MLLLCAANLPYSSGTTAYPRTPTVRSLGFANCLISSYQRIPQRELVEDCSLEHGIDFRALNKCASRQVDDDDGDDGRNGSTGPDDVSGLALLRKSFKRSEKLGITTSCTIRVDDQIWCIRDDGKWKNCTKGGTGMDVSVLVHEIEALWKARN